MKNLASLEAFTVKKNEKEWYCQCCGIVMYNSSSPCADCAKRFNKVRFIKNK